MISYTVDTLETDYTENVWVRLRWSLNYFSTSVNRGLVDSHTGGRVVELRWNTPQRGKTIRLQY